MITEASGARGTRPQAYSLPHARQARIGLWALGVLYALLYLVFWPPIHTTMDESAYLNQAYALRQGTLYSDVAGISTVQSYPVGPRGRQHVISQYPPGMGGLLAGLSLAGWHAALGLNLAIHLISFALLAQVLRRLGLSPLWAGLYLLHPTAVIFSRTTMSDLGSGLLTLLAFALYLRGRLPLAGVVIGLGVWMRTVGGLALPLLCLGAFVDALIPVLVTGGIPPITERIKKGLLNVARIAFGAVPFVLGAWLYQKTLQDGGWAKYSGEGLLGFQHFPHQFPQYALQLGLMFPLLIIAPAFYRRPGRGALISLCYGVLLFYSCYYFQDTTGSKIESFVIGLRFLLMVLPLFIIAYAAMIQDFVGRMTALRRYESFALPLAVVVSLILLAGAGGIHWQHQKFLRKSALIRDVVASSLSGTENEGATLICNVHVAKLLHPGWSGAHHYEVIGGQDAPGKAERAVRDALQTGKPTYLAFWSRPYRPETPGEMDILSQLTRRFPTEKVTLAGGALPPDVYLLRVLQRLTVRKEDALRIKTTKVGSQRGSATQAGHDQRNE